MNNFDGPREKEMTELLNYLYSLSKGGSLNCDAIYHVLCYYNLKPEERIKYNGCEALEGISNEQYFKLWEDGFKKRRNINAFRDYVNFSYFFQFVNDRFTSRDGYIKLYVPLDYRHLYYGVGYIFDYLDKANIMHASKVSKKMRVDNVIIRVNINDTASAKKIIDFISNNEYIKSGLNKTNPFIPTINGIGIMKERGNSYNRDISNYILKYLEICKQKNVPSVTASSFKSFLDTCKVRNLRFDGKDEEFDNYLYDTFIQAYSGKNALKLNDEVSVDDKSSLIRDAIIATYNKYGYSHIYGALIKAVNGNYSSITNGEENQQYREKMNRLVNEDDIVEYIKKELLSSDIEAKEDITLMVDQYCKMMFYEKLPSLLDEICIVTLDKYDEEQLRGALIDFINFGSIGKFSRYSPDNNGINYRDQLKYFDKKRIVDTLRASLVNKEISVENLSLRNLLDTYVRVLNIDRYRTVQNNAFRKIKN